LLDPIISASLNKKDIADYRSWLKILKWLKKRRPDVELERLRLIAENDITTADKLQGLMAEISSVFSGSPGPHGKLSIILKEIDRLLDRNEGAIDIAGSNASSIN
jgi:hypothetical protein